MAEITWIDEGGMPVHCPIEVTKEGFGPASGAESFMTICWCADDSCTLFYGKVCDTFRGRYIHVDPTRGLPHRGCLLR